MQRKDLMMTEYFDVGKIVNTHGIKGEVRVNSITNYPKERYYEGSPLVLFKENEEPIELIIKSHRVHKNFDLLTFKDHFSINEVEKYVGGVLKVSEDYLFELSDDEFYLHEIIGLQVVDEEGENIGTVKEILSPGANDVWVVQRQGQKDLLLPYIDSVILHVDLEKNQVIVHVMEGLDE